MDMYPSNTKYTLTIYIVPILNLKQSAHSSLESLLHAGDIIESLVVAFLPLARRVNKSNKYLAEFYRISADATNPSVA